jgi:hypothetical protein
MILKILVRQWHWLTCDLVYTLQKPYVKKNWRHILSRELPLLGIIFKN